jgi:16S rRNA C1402 (ribose-2'-O) methylase RsmI
MALPKMPRIGISYTALPGACALINAAVLSGLPIQRFLGFMPKKDGDIKKYWRNIKWWCENLYESPRGKIL